MKLPLQTFRCINNHSRFTFYETWFTRTIAIVEEDLWEDVWSIKSSVSIPKDLFSLLRTECSPKITPQTTNMTDTVEEPFSTTIIYDRFELPSAVRQLLYEIDCRNVPFSENQMGYLSDMETLEWYWGIKGSPESPDDGSTSLYNNIGDAKQVCASETPKKPEIITMKDCPQAPKKMKKSGGEKPTFQVSQLDLTGL